MANIIPDLLTDEMRKAINWGMAHPEEMKKDKCPFDFMDNRWDRWQLAKYAEKLAAMDEDQQKKEHEKNVHMAKKMSS